MYVAVVHSCGAREDAVAVEEFVKLESATEFAACVTPTAPGVTDVMFAAELEPITRMIEWKVTGIE
jgi:hypothetical protein